MEKLRIGNPIEAVKGAFQMRRLHKFVEDVHLAEEESYNRLPPISQARFSTGALAFNLRQEVGHIKESGEEPAERINQLEEQASYFETVHRAVNPLEVLRRFPPTEIFPNKVNSEEKSA